MIDASPYIGTANLRKARKLSYRKEFSYRHETIEAEKVARWSELGVKQKKNRDCDVWMMGKDRRIRIRKGSQRMEELLQTLEMNTKNVVFKTIRAGFLEGRRLENDIATIRTSPGPSIAFRAVDEGQPFGGIKARGYGTWKTNRTFFQRDVQNHLNWKCREKGTFMSIINDYDTAIRKCAF